MNNNLICPACGKEMSEILIKDANIKLDVCLDGCGGIYFDNREFKHFDEPHENIDEILEAIKGKDFIKVDDKQIRNCPVCGAKMVKNHASVKHEVLVDECYSCGGKFLDNGELQKIRGQYKTEEERSEDMLKLADELYGDQMRKMEAEHTYNMAHRSVTKKLFDSLMNLE